MKRLCVFCGAKSGAHPDYAAAARGLGKELAARGVGIVYGGGNVGLMGELADAALAGGGEVIGVIPRVLVEREGHQGLTELRVVDSMHERKALMGELADALVALPGGFGTIEELLETLAWAQLGLHEKPCALLNVRGYFDRLLDFLDNAVGQGLLKREHRELLVVLASPEDFLARLP